MRPLRLRLQCATRRAAVRSTAHDSAAKGIRMNKHVLLLAAALAATLAQAQETRVAIGISGWTGFAPLTLAKEAGIFKKHGLDVTIKKIPQKDRHLAIASGDVQCAATTV